MSAEELPGSPAHASASSDSPATGQKRKRGPRASLACESCRRRKTACDQQQPCAVCQRYSLPCVYREAAAWNIRRSNSSNTYSGLPDGGPRQGQGSTVASTIPPVPPDATSPDGFIAVNGVGTLEGHSQNGHNGLPVFVPATRAPQYRQQRLPSLSHNEPKGQKSRPEPAGRTPKATRNQKRRPSNVFASLHELRTDQKSFIFFAFPRPESKQDSVQDIVRALVTDTSELRALTYQYITRQCVRQYFQNTHALYPILDEAAFTSAREPYSTSHRTSTFSPLFDIVVALGALIPGDETSLSRAAPTLPLRLAKLFYELAKSKIMDHVEEFSQEIAQAQLLLSVFCQQTLKPNSAYRYAGMAAQNVSRMRLDDSLCVVIYLQQVEMELALGLNNISMPPDRPPPKGGSAIRIIDYLAESLKFAHVHQRTRTLQAGTAKRRCDQAKTLEDLLAGYKEGLPPSLTWENMSLLHLDWLPKQKIALRIRHLYIALIIHRPFMPIAAASKPDNPALPEITKHAEDCVQVARELLETVYRTFAQNRFFRTYWYNLVYVFHACMAILYSVLARSEPLPNAEDLFRDVNKGLEIFHAMGKVAIAQSCADVVSEVVRTAREVTKHRGRDAVHQSQHGERSSHGLPDAISTAISEHAANATMGLRHEPFDMPSPEQLESLLLLNDTHIAMLADRDMPRDLLSRQETVLRDVDELLGESLRRPAFEDVPDIDDDSP